MALYPSIHVANTPSRAPAEAHRFRKLLDAYQPPKCSCRDRKHLSNFVSLEKDDLSFRFILFVHFDTPHRCNFRR